MGITAAQLQAVVSVSGADKAKSDLQSVGNSANATGGLLKNALGGALSFASGMAGQALGFLKNQLVDTVQVAMQHQQVMAQTAQAIKSTGDASGMTSTSIGDLAMSLSKVTEFSDNTIQSGENLLLTFTGIGKKVFPETTKAMLDLSQATGQDMKSSAIQLGKALNDPLTGMSALQRVGVTFSAEEQKSIKTMMAHNDVMGAQKVMLHELETEFGGSATAVGKTFAGQVQILKNNFEDLKQQIGGAILPVLTQFLGMISSYIMPVLEKFGDWFVSTAIPNIQSFVAKLSPITDVFHQLGNVAVVMGDDIHSVFYYITQAIEPFISQLSSLKNVFPSIDSLVGDAEAVIDNLANGFNKATDQISVFLSHLNLAPLANAMSFIGEELGHLFSLNAAPFANAISFLGEELGYLFSSLGRIADAILSQFAPSFSSTNNTIMSFARGAIGFLSSALNGVVQGILQFNQYLHGLDLSKITGDVKQFVGILSGQFAQTLHFVGDEIKQIGGWFQSSVVPALRQAEPGFANLAQVILGTVLPALMQIRGVVIDVAEHAFKALLPIIEQLVPPLIALAGNIANGLAVALRIIAPIVVGVVKGIGDLANFLIGILAPVIKQIVTTFNTQLLPAIMGLMPAFRALQPLLTGVAAVIGGVLAIALGLLVGLFVGVVKGAAALLTGLIQAFGGIVQMISGAVQIISGIIGLLVDIFTGNFGHIQADLQSFVSGVLSLFTGFGNVFMGIFGGLFLGIWGLVSGFVQGVIGFFMHLYDTLVGHSIIPDMVNGIISWFQQLPGRAMSAISSLAGSIGGFFSNLTGQAMAWGSDLVNGIASGITSAIGAVTSAASNVASAIASILHHSKPEIGPLAHDDEWMPDFMQLLSSGIEQNMDKIRNSSLKVGATISATMSSPLPSLGTSNMAPSGGFASALSSNLQGASVVPANGVGNNTQPIQVVVQPAPVHLDGRVLAGALLPYSTDLIRYSIGSHNI